MRSHFIVAIACSVWLSPMGVSVQPAFGVQPQQSQTHAAPVIHRNVQADRITEPKFSGAFDKATSEVMAAAKSFQSLPTIEHLYFVDQQINELAKSDVVATPIEPTSAALAMQHDGSMLMLPSKDADIALSDFSVHFNKGILGYILKLGGDTAVCNLSGSKKDDAVFKTATGEIQVPFGTAVFASPTAKDIKDSPLAQLLELAGSTAVGSDGNSTIYRCLISYSVIAELSPQIRAGMSPNADPALSKAVKSFWKQAAINEEVNQPTDNAAVFGNSNGPGQVIVAALGNKQANNDKSSTSDTGDTTADKDKSSTSDTGDTTADKDKSSTSGTRDTTADREILQDLQNLGFLDQDVASFKRQGISVQKLAWLAQAGYTPSDLSALSALGLKTGQLLALHQAGFTAQQLLSMPKGQIVAALKPAPAPVQTAPIAVRSLANVPGPGGPSEEKPTVVGKPEAAGAVLTNAPVPATPVSLGAGATKAPAPVQTAPIAVRSLANVPGPGGPSEEKPTVVGKPEAAGAALTNAPVPATPVTTPNGGASPANAPTSAAPTGYFAPQGAWTSPSVQKASVTYLLQNGFTAKELEKEQPEAIAQLAAFVQGNYYSLNDVKTLISDGFLPGQITKLQQAGFKGNQLVTMPNGTIQEALKDVGELEKGSGGYTGPTIKTLGFAGFTLHQMVELQSSFTAAELTSLQAAGFKPQELVTLAEDKYTYADLVQLQANNFTPGEIVTLHDAGYGANQLLKLQQAGFTGKQLVTMPSGTILAALKFIGKLEATNYTLQQIAQLGLAGFSLDEMVKLQDDGYTGSQLTSLLSQNLKPNQVWELAQAGYVDSQLTQLLGSNFTIAQLLTLRDAGFGAIQVETLQAAGYDGKQLVKMPTGQILKKLRTLQSDGQSAWLIAAGNALGYSGTNAQIIQQVSTTPSTVVGGTTSAVTPKSRASGTGTTKSTGSKKSGPDPDQNTDIVHGAKSLSEAGHDGFKSGNDDAAENEGGPSGKVVNSEPEVKVFGDGPDPTTMQRNYFGNKKQPQADNNDQPKADEPEVKVSGDGPDPTTMQRNYFGNKKQPQADNNDQPKADEPEVKVGGEGPDPTTLQRNYFGNKKQPQADGGDQPKADEPEVKVSGDGPDPTTMQRDYFGKPSLMKGDTAEMDVPGSKQIEAEVDAGLDDAMDDIYDDMGVDDMQVITPGLIVDGTPSTASKSAVGFTPTAQIVGVPSQTWQNNKLQKINAIVARDILIQSSNPQAASTSNTFETLLHDPSKLINQINPLNSFIAQCKQMASTMEGHPPTQPGPFYELVPVPQSITTYNRAVRQLYGVANQWHNASQQASNIQSQVTDAQNQLSQVDSSMNSVQNQISQVQTVLAQAVGMGQSQSIALAGPVAKLTAKLQQLNTELGSLQVQAKAGQDKINNLQAQLKVANGTVNAWALQEQSAQNNVNQLYKQLPTTWSPFQLTPVAGQSATQQPSQQSQPNAAQAAGEVN